MQKAIIARREVLDRRMDRFYTRVAKLYAASSLALFAGILAVAFNFAHVVPAVVCSLGAATGGYLCARWGSDALYQRRTLRERHRAMYHRLIDRQLRRWWAVRSATPVLVPFPRRDAPGRPN